MRSAFSRFEKSGLWYTRTTRKRSSSTAKSDLRLREFSKKNTSGTANGTTWCGWVLSTLRAEGELKNRKLYNQKPRLRAWLCCLVARNHRADFLLGEHSRQISCRLKNVKYAQGNVVFAGVGYCRRIEDLQLQFSEFLVRNAAYHSRIRMFFRVFIEDSIDF